jgi:hypothetical protein
MAIISGAKTLVTLHKTEVNTGKNVLPVKNVSGIFEGD